MEYTQRERYGVLSAVSFAKSREHEEHLLVARGQIRGRYLISLLVSVGVIGGNELRRRIEEELGRTYYMPEQMYPARELVFICHHAAGAELPMARLGETVAPTFKRAHPEYFLGRTVDGLCEIIERAYREETTYHSLCPEHFTMPGYARMFRKNQPTPCGLFEGVLKGFLATLETVGTAEEVACQWEGASSCTYDIHWRTQTNA
jgi:uncharacterized protein (TIGR02265 family)